MNQNTTKTLDLLLGRRERLLKKLKQREKLAQRARAAAVALRHELFVVDHKIAAIAKRQRTAEGPVSMARLMQ